MFKGISVHDFNQFFQDENRCREYLFDLKWNSGYECRRCGNNRFYKGRTKFHARCSKCKYDESVTAHTIFHRIQFSLKKAFSMAFQIAVYKKGISSIELAKKFEVNQKTAWIFKRKIQEAVGDSFPGDNLEVVDQRSKKIDGVILMDRSKEMSGLQSVSIVIKKFDCNRKNKWLAKYSLQNSDKDSKEPCSLIGGRYVETGKDIKMWNFRGWLTGTHHHCSKKYFRGYLNEFFFRLNRRGDENIILHDLLHCMIHSKPYHFIRQGASKV